MGTCGIEIPLILQMANEKEVTKKDATPTPAPNPAPQATPTDAEILAAAERVKLAKAENEKKIVEMQSAISKAKADATKWAKNGNPDDDEIHDMMEAKHPGWYQRKLDLVIALEKDLSDFKLSLLTPAQKELATKWQELLDRQAKLATEKTELETKIKAEYPDFFGPAKAERKKSEGGEKTAKSEDVIPFTGELLSKEEATKRVKELVAAGTTSESAIIEAIYGKDFTINGSKPRFQIHAIRIAEGLVAKK